MPTITRAERAEARRVAALSPYDDKLHAFLDFVLSQYVARGVEELGSDKLASLLELKYRAVSDATVQLGANPTIIRQAFVGFHKAHATRSCWESQDDESVASRETWLYPHGCRQARRFCEKLGIPK